jgi:hypothetical protein
VLGKGIDVCRMAEDERRPLSRTVLAFNASMLPTLRAVFRRVIPGAPR